MPKANNLIELLANRETQRIYRERTRLKVLKHYGGDPPRCKCCGETIIEFLGIDHIDGRTTKEKDNSSFNTYLHAVANGFPSNLQVLCHNCNMAKGFYGECPHEKSKRLDAELRIAQEAVNAHRRSAS